MTAREIVIGLVGTALVLGVLALFFDMPPTALFVIGGSVVGGAALGLAMRRWMDRTEAEALSHRAGNQGTRFDVAYRRTSGGGYYTVTTTFAGDPGWFSVYDLKQSAGMRMFKRLGLSYRLEIDDENFNREIYVERNPRLGAVLFASAGRREAARAVFRLGFFAIQYRGGLVSVLCRRSVPNDVAAAVRPYLTVLARSAGEAGTSQV